MDSKEPAGAQRPLVTIDGSGFQREVLESPVPVLVDFWAKWCSPCRLIEATLKQLAQDYLGRVKVVRIDADNSPTFMELFGIRGLPTVLLFVEGELIKSTLGVRTGGEYRRMVDKALASYPPNHGAIVPVAAVAGLTPSR